MSKKIQPKPVIKIKCPKCGELQLKIYPYSTLGVSDEIQIPLCGKCLN